MNGIRPGKTTKTRDKDYKSTNISYKLNQSQLLSEIGSDRSQPKSGKDTCPPNEQFCGQSVAILGVSPPNSPFRGEKSKKKKNVAKSGLYGAKCRNIKIRKLLFFFILSSDRFPLPNFVVLTLNKKIWKKKMKRRPRNARRNSTPTYYATSCSKGCFAARQTRIC